MKKILCAVAATALLSTASLALAETAQEGMAAAGEKAGSMLGQAADTVADAAGLVNINTADVETLAGIPGIDENLAKAITEYRNTKGPFGSVDDLKNVEGMNAALLEKIAPMVKF